MKLTLYSNYVNSAGERVRIALALKRVDYQYISARQFGWEKYRQLNPQHLMPALVVRGQMVPQSTAILEYLEEQFPTPALLPANSVLRAQARGFAQHITSEMHAIDVARVRKVLTEKLGVDELGIQTWHHHWFHAGFANLEQMMVRRETAWPYCYGDQPGWADVHLVPQVRKATERFGIDMAPYPLIDAIARRCLMQPAFIAASPKMQPDYPGPE